MLPANAGFVSPGSLPKQFFISSLFLFLPIIFNINCVKIVDKIAPVNHINPFKSLLKIAKLGGLKNDEIKVCVSNKSIEDGILKKRLNSTKKFEIKATPTIYINGKKYNGDLTFEALKLKLDSLIN